MVVSIQRAELSFPHTWWPSLETYCPSFKWCMMARLFLQFQWPSGLSFLGLLGVFMKNIVMKCSYTLTFRLKCLGCSCCISQLSGVGLFRCLIPQWCHNTEFWTALYIAMATDWCHTLKDMTSVHDHAEAQSDLWRRKLTNAHLKSKQGECRLQLTSQGASVWKFPA